MHAALTRPLLGSGALAVQGQCLLPVVQDAMETAAQSGEEEIAEELLRFFVDNGERECFAALLYTCYELIKPDVALEVHPLTLH